MIRYAVVRSVLSIVVLAVALAGCSNTQGSPSPETTDGTASATDPKATTSSTSEADGLAGFDACGQLEGAASELGLASIEEDGVQECEAVYDRTIAVRIKAFPELGIEEYVPGPKSDITDLSVGGHRAKRVTAPSTASTCAVTIEITSSSRVDVVASANASLDAACEAATKVATAIEPNLP